MNSCKRNILGINESAQKKRLQTIAKAEEGIKQLIRESKPITFEAVAKVSGVSRAWLYKESEIKARIEHLRNQQQSKKSVPPVQKASEASNTAKAQALLQEIKKLRAENQGLRHHIEEILGRSIYADEQAERHKKEAEVLEVKNTELKQQLEECYRRKVEAPASPPHNPKVTFLEQKRTRHLVVSDKIKQELIELGIQLNSTLTKVIKSVPEEKALDAIEAFKQAMLSDNIEKPGAWLEAAIEDGWRKNQPHSCEATTGTTSKFSEWFELAKAQGVAQTKQETEEGLMIQDATGQWMSWESLVERGWTLEYLKKRAKPK